MVKRLPAMREIWVRSLGRENPLEKEMATHSSTLAWKIPWRSLVGYSPWDHKESDTTERLHFTQLRRKEILSYLKEKPPPCLSTHTFLQLRREGKVLVGIYPFGGGDLRTLALSRVQVQTLNALDMK